MRKRKSGLFDEKDIQFEKLNSKEFEELCFDVISQSGYHDLIWRQGGADSGRDIEASFLVKNPLLPAVEFYTEKWFFECKCYHGGVPVSEIEEKFAWADAERPKHLVLIVSSYLANNTRTWIEKRRKGSFYQTHIIEGKYLKTLLLGFPDLIDKYFADKYRKLLNDVKRNWIMLNLLSDPNSLYLLDQHLNYEKLSIADKAFLWCIWHMKRDEIEQWFEDEEVDYQDIRFSPKKLESILLDNSKISKSIIDGYDGVKMLTLNKVEQHGGNIHVMYAQLFVKTNTKILRALYCLKPLSQDALSQDEEDALSQDEGIEVIVEGDVELSAKIRHIQSNIDTECERVEDVLYVLHKSSHVWKAQ
jgi:hypothetical protein